MKTNIVIAGKYEGSVIEKSGDGKLVIVVPNPRVAEIKQLLWHEQSLTIAEKGQLMEERSQLKKKPLKVAIASENVLSIENGDKNTKTSATSAVIRGAVGNLLIGPLGLLAAVGAKKKSTYLVAVTWRDGTKSVLSLNGEFYTQLLAY